MSYLEVSAEIIINRLSRPSLPLPRPLIGYEHLFSPNTYK